VEDFLANIGNEKFSRADALTTVAEPIKLFFFANKEFFCFLLVSLRVCYI